MNQSDRKPRKGATRLNRDPLRPVKQVRNVPVDSVDKVVNELIKKFHELTRGMDKANRLVAAKHACLMLGMVE